MINKASWTTIVDNMGLCYKVAQQIIPLPSPITIEDLVSEPGLDALIRCERSWNPERGKFSTYAFRSIHRSMVKYISEKIKHKGVQLEDEPCRGNLLEKNEASQDAYTILSRVSAFDRMVLLLRFWKCLTIKELGVVLECSSTQAFLHIREAIIHCQKSVQNTH